MESSTPLEALMERLRARRARPVWPQPSLSEHELLELLESHAEHETEALHAYEDLAGESPDEHVRYVAALLLDDERRHHQLLAEMANRVRGDAEWRPLEPSVPHLGVSHDRTGLLDMTAPADTDAQTSPSPPTVSIAAVARRRHPRVRYP
jgi:hypothetical protein